MSAAAALARLDGGCSHELVRREGALAQPREQGRRRPTELRSGDFAGSRPKASSTSAAPVTGVAPSRSSAFVPAESGS